jgi:hypothetical protein
MSIEKSRVYFSVSAPNGVEHTFEASDVEEMEALIVMLKKHHFVPSIGEIMTQTAATKPSAS